MIDTVGATRYILDIGNSPTGETEMTQIDRFDARRVQMLRELQSDLADLVESGDMTAQEANEWVNNKADQWAREG